MNIINRLKDVSLFKQTNDVNDYGEQHYTNVRNFLNNDVGIRDINMLIESINMIRTMLLSSKSNSIISNNCQNILVNKQSSSLLSKININLNSSICSIPGLDIGITLANYVYCMPYQVNKDKYINFENNIRIFWNNYNITFVQYSGNSNRDIILQKILRYS